MNNYFRIPPVSKSFLTLPEVLAERLRPLIGTQFRLTHITRIDGSNARKLIANAFEQYSLPPLCANDSYIIVPPRKKGVPRILLEYVDTYIVTTGTSYNLQVWNRNPASNSIQVEYTSGDQLLACDVRFVFVRIDPGEYYIRSILVLSPEYIEAKFGRFGKPTIKHQLIISPRTREFIFRSNPPILFDPDTPGFAPFVINTYRVPSGSIRDTPIAGNILSLEVIRDIVVTKLIGTRLDAAATKNRGQVLEQLVAQHLGYPSTPSGLLLGGYPDILNQALEVKVQDSPTVDLGKWSPQFPEKVPSCLKASTSDIRYLIALTNEKTSTIEGVVLCPGSELGHHFSYISDKSYKCQRSIPMSFFDRYDGQALYNPEDAAIVLPDNIPPV